MVATQTLSGVNSFGGVSYVSQSFGDRLRTLADVRRLNNPATNPSMSSPPTITQGFSADSGNTVAHLVSDAVVPVTVYGGSIVGGALTSSSGQYRLAFHTDAPIVSFFSNFFDNNAAFRLNVIVDNQYAAKTVTTASLNNNNVYTVINLGSRAVRRIDIEVTNLQFKGIYVSPIDRIWPVTKVEPRCVVVGDSYTGTGTSGQPAGSFMYVAGHILGWEMVGDISGPGGTGYIAASSGGTFISRLANTTALTPDIVLVAGGLNDASNTSAAIQSAVSAEISALRSALPNALIFVNGPWRGANTNAGQIATCASAVAAGVAAVADSRIFHVPTVTDPAGPWQFGTGYQTTPNSSGNSDVYIGGDFGSDQVHPNLAGHAYLGRLNAIAIRKALEQVP